MKTTISILIAILCFTNVFAQRGETKNEELPLKKRYKTNNGIFIYNGKYIEPPYVIKVKDFAVYINGIQFRKKNIDHYKTYIVKKDPGYPKGVNKFTTYNELFALKTIDNKFFTGTKEKYYYSTYPKLQARDSIIAFYRNLPNIEYFEKTSFETTFSLKTYADKNSILISIAPNGYKEPYLAKPTKRNKLLKAPKEAAFNLYEDLKKGKCIFRGNDSCGMHEDIIDVDSINFPKIINFLTKDTISEVEKQYLHDSLNFWYRPYCKNFKLTNKLQQRIQQIISDKNKKTELNNNNLKSKSINSLGEANINKGLQSTTSSYSPKTKSVKAWCSITDNFPYFQSDVNKINTNLQIQDYNAVEIFSTNGFDNNVGTCTYSNFQDLCNNAGVIYFDGHGRDEGLVIVTMSNECDVYTWLGEPCDQVPNNPNIQVLNFDNYWSAVFNSTWAAENWRTQLINNKTITMLNACLTYENGWLQAITGTNEEGVAFGFSDLAIENQSFDFYWELLKWMNGKNTSTGNVKHRVAYDAHSKINLGNWEYFKIIPTDANITLCPSSTDLTTTFNDFSTYCEINFDTWCAVSNTSNLLSLSNISPSTGTAEIKEIIWENDGSGKSNKLKFKISACSNFQTVKITVNENAIYSYANGGVGHKLDFDGNSSTSTNSFTLTYTGSKSTQSVDFYADNTQLEIGESTTFHISGSTVGVISWKFEGGSPSISSNPSPTIQYNTQGTFDVNLTIENSNSCTNVNKSNYITVTDNGSGNNLSVNCSYTDNGVKTITAYADVTGGSGWYTYYFSFSDGTSNTITGSFSESVTHTFSNYGAHSVSVTVCDANYPSNNGSCYENILMPNPVPCSDLNADFSISPSTIVPNQTYSITDLTSGGSLQYTWCWYFLDDPYSPNYNENGIYNECINGYFHDSGLPSLPNYSSPGKYSISLHVWDTEGCNDFITHEIVVVDPQKCISNLRIENSSNSNTEFVDNSTSNCYFYFNINYYLKSNTACIANGVSLYNACNSDATRAYWFLNNTIVHVCNNNYLGINLSMDCKGFTLEKSLLQPGLNNLKLVIDNAYETDPSVSFYAETSIKIILLDCNYTAYIDSYWDLLNPNIFVQNTPQLKTITAGNFIIDGNEYIKNLINTQNTKFVACNEITLSDGFESGSKEFTASISQFYKCTSINFKNTLLVSPCEELDLTKNNLIAYPIPFVEKTTLFISLLEDGLTNLSIYDLNGKLIKTIVNTKKEAGNYEIVFWGNDLADGVYICKLIHNNKLYSIKLIKGSNKL